jgi:hypothetical protein
MIDVLAPCLAFVETYSPSKAHDMMTILFDPCHKNMKVIREYVGDSFPSRIVEEYDQKMVLPQLCQIYKFLNPTSVALFNLAVSTYDDGHKHGKVCQLVIPINN